jgi:hypothetical protein
MAEARATDTTDTTRKVLILILILGTYLSAYYSMPKVVHEELPTIPTTLYPLAREPTVEARRAKKGVMKLQQRTEKKYDLLVIGL